MVRCVGVGVLSLMLERVEVGRATAFRRLCLSPTQAPIRSLRLPQPHLGRHIICSILTIVQIYNTNEIYLDNAIYLLWFNCVFSSIVIGYVGDEWPCLIPHHKVAQ